MWDDLRQIALLGTNNSQLSESHKAIMKRFGIDTTKEASLVVLDAIALWNKMKAVGFQCENWAGDTSPSIATRATFASANLSKQVGVMLKYKGYEKLLPEVFKKLSEKDISFPTEHLPKLMQALKNDSNLYFEIKEGLEDRFYWLAKQHPSWRIYCLENPEDDITKTKIAEEKKQILLLWLKKNQTEALIFLTINLDKFSHEFWKALLDDFLNLEPAFDDEFKNILEQLHGQKNKQSFGVCSNLLMHYQESTFTKNISEQVSKILIVSEEEIHVNEKEIENLKTIIPKSSLPFSRFKSRDKIFDKNLFYHALAICSPEILFSQYFKMGLDDFLNTVKSLGFYDELIVQAMIYSASEFRYKPLLNALIKMYRIGDFPLCNWRPILDLLPAKALSGEFNLLYNDDAHRFDHRMVHLFCAKNFNWPPKAVQFYSEILSAHLDQQKLSKKDLFFQLFEQMILKCNPHFYYDLKSELITIRVFSFQSNALIEKQMKILKLRLEFEKELKNKK